MLDGIGTPGASDSGGGRDGIHGNGLGDRIEYDGGLAHFGLSVIILIRFVFKAESHVQILGGNAEMKVMFNE